MKIQSAIISLGYFAVLLSACNLDSYPQEKKATPQPEYSAPSPTTASRVLPTPEQLQHQRRFINAMSRGPAQAARGCTTNTAQEHDLVRNATPQSLVARKVACNPSLQIPPKEVKRQTPKLVSTGSGFVVSSRSQVLTNAHVVNDCDGVSVQTRDGRINAKHIARDISYDLALIDLPWPTDDIAVFRNGGGVRPGDQVVVVGFPLHGLLSREPNVTIGNVSALAGAPVPARRRWRS